MSTAYDGTVLALDPSYGGSCGVAAFRDGRLTVAGDVSPRMYGTREADDPVVRALNVARAVIKWGECNAVRPAVLACEWPQIYRATKSKGDPNQIVPLAAVVQAVATLQWANNPQIKIVSYKPAEWAGQLPKDTKNPKSSPRGLRILSKLESSEVTIWSALGHDAIDAVGIGLHYLGRLTPHRVFAGATVE